MAKRETLQQIADRLEPGVRRAFLDSIGRIKGDVQMQLLVDAIAANDTPRVIRLLNLDAAYFAPLDRGLTSAYQEVGDTVMAALMAEASAAGAQVRAVFDARNPRAEEWLRTQSSRLIREITDDQRESVRRVLTANIERGTAPRTTALDIVGRVNRTTGKREGGILGLHSRDVAARQRALEELRASPRTDAGKAQLRNYLNRKTRDRRFDSAVRRALRDGKRIPAEKARKMLVGMERKMLRNRGETIARTELLGSTNAAQEEGLNQLIESEKVSRQNIKSTWDASEDGATRDSHRFMDGQVRTHGETFTTGAGFELLYPGDRSHGAPAEEIINCFAPWTMIGLAGLEGAVVSAYFGDLVELVTGDGVDLTVTPKHPILTGRGWVPAGQIVEGDELLQSVGADFGDTPAEPDVGNRYARAEQLHEAMKRAGGVRRTRRSVVNLHGHVPGHDVDVVSLPSKLRGALNSTVAEVFGNVSFAVPDISKGGSGLFRRMSLSRVRPLAASDSSVGRFRAGASALVGCDRGRSSVAFADRRPLDTEVRKARVDRAAPHTKSLGNVADRVAALKERLHALMVGFATLFVVGGYAFPHGPRGTAWLREPEVCKAGLNPSLGNTDCTRNASQRRVRGISILDRFKKWAALPAPAFKVAVVGRVRRRHYSGPVYDFQSSNGILLANGLVAHNCRCVKRPDIDWIAQAAQDEEAFA